MAAPTMDGDKWVDWAYVKGRRAMKPVKALRIRDELEKPIISEQYWPVKWKCDYEAATNGRKPKSRQDLRALKLKVEGKTAIRASMVPTIEGGAILMRDDNGYLINPYVPVSEVASSRANRKRKRESDGAEKPRKKRSNRSDERPQERKARKAKKIYVSPYYEFREFRGIRDPPLQTAARNPVLEAEHERLMAGNSAPDYSHIIDKKDGEVCSWVDSESELDSSDSSDESDDDRGCYGTRLSSAIDELGYETECLPAEELEAIIEQHSQEFNSPAARAERNAILRQWNYEDEHGLFFGRPIRRTRAPTVLQGVESMRSDTTEELEWIDPTASIESTC